MNWKRKTLAVAGIAALANAQLAFPAEAFSPHDRAGTFPRVPAQFSLNQGLPLYAARASVGMQHWGLRHPLLKRSLIGTGLGLVAGGLVGGIAGHGRFGKGLLIGGGTGALAGIGLGLLRQNRCLHYGAC